MFESIEAYRESEISELNDLIKIGVESDHAIAKNYPDMIRRLRLLNHFSRDLSGLVEHVQGIANRNAVADWARAAGSSTMSELPWSKVSDACSEILAEPPIYKRDWTLGPVVRNFEGALDT
ncbi:hypothetical protein GIY30_02450 [Gordonia sp. HNM0687]|uniref:Uncharacterized protein n=1 Tax=Gordonia mangrovi TaxID=2665643 RepID=A0A6L7GJX5_9ACTN|nr:hypothetical protein [Gordonia mangrovi]MXP20229.1 hypothetical protein [Gordonia mangrovi]UVF79161.1 hypothetical protein NWF22_04775 [Gordonia mangrovi]